MGTASTKKILKQSAGSLVEEAALTTTAGAADADRIPALNASGVLDISIINGKNASAGAADAGKVVVLGGDGKISATMISATGSKDSMMIQASEALAAGDYVNIHDVSGAFRVRKADATSAGKEAHGFVEAVVASGAQAEVVFEGTNTQVTGQTPGKVFLQTTAGRGAAAVPSASGNVVQCVGYATSATSVNFQANQPIVLA